MKAERDRLLDRLARLQAEFENARKRAERERAEYREYATGSVAEQFLTVLDNLELALKAKGSAEQLRSGVSLIMKQMEEILEKMQVKVVPTVGEEFDPRFHEALGTVERDECRISTWPKKFAGDTRFASGCCGRRWCAWRTMRNKWMSKEATSISRQLPAAKRVEVGAVVAAGEIEVFEAKRATKNWKLEAEND